MTQRHILLFWSPLAVSFLLMTGEILLVQAALGRLPDEKVMLAALGVMFWLEVLIEAPIIMLLSTSTALSSSPQAYRVLKRFAWHITAVVTAVAAAVAWLDPVFDLVVRSAMGIPPPVADPSQAGMKIMTLWSAIIAWRRFNQGILIRYGQPRQVTWGTLVRLLTSAATAFTLASQQAASGIVVAACTFMAGVTAEGLFAAWKVRPVVARHLSGPDDPSQTPVSYRGVLDFHLPLAATSVLSFIVLPVINAGLARMPAPTETLAAWPVLFAALLIFRGPGIALPEAIIALLRSAADLAPLRRFGLVVSVASSLGLLLATTTPALPAYLSHVVAVQPELQRLILPGATAALALPVAAGLGNLYRGELMAGRATAVVYRGMALHLACVGASIGAGVLAGTPGLLTAVAAVTLATVVESGYLGWRARKVADVWSTRKLDAPC